MKETFNLRQHTLPEWYAYFNDVYFANKLPKHLKVRWSKKPRYYAHTCFNKKWEPEFIEIQAEHRKWPSVAAMSLLHEMAHVSEVQGGDVHSDHGLVFKAIMHRLVDDGAFEPIW